MNFRKNKLQLRVRDEVVHRLPDDVTGSDPKSVLRPERGPGLVDVYDPVFCVDLVYEEALVTNSALCLPHGRDLDAKTMTVSCRAAKSDFYVRAPPGSGATAIFCYIF